MATVAGTKLKSLGETFNDRVSAEELNYALSYIDFGEEPLALEMLCDCICEHEIIMTKNEYENICKLNSSLNNPLGKNVINHLKSLARI
ncbi:MafI family immunity protein [Pseudomonas sp. DCB_BI]|uniref:MafI family immunity protein n=1 Tax=Pseudomonas sp. DCB_BI TaxID=2993594 RepID=UPI003A4E535F|nr:MafI family immunity protein [Pseudomonas sp. BN607]